MAELFTWKLAGACSPMCPFWPFVSWRKMKALPVRGLKEHLQGRKSEGGGSLRGEPTVATPSRPRPQFSSLANPYCAFNTIWKRKCRAEVRAWVCTCVGACVLMCVCVCVWERDHLIKSVAWDIFCQACCLNAWRPWRRKRFRNHKHSSRLWCTVEWFSTDVHINIKDNTCH